MALSPYEVFRRPILTEKTTIQRERYTERPGRPDIIKYVVEVDPKATKDDIRAAVEFLFPDAQGAITKINTIRTNGKARDADKNRRTRRFRPGKTREQKKAIITLRAGVTIPQFEGF
ncbi:50S ribosomal protein L23 [Candidatus Poribacteria bacterium]|jgi:ribosomal protein L23|nr:50S ribosomal protein L23 [Candidatus Poribacteria bacterium]